MNCDFEEKLLLQYEPFIRSTTRRYLQKITAPGAYRFVEDCMSEARIAFLTVLRRKNICHTPLTKAETAACAGAMRFAIRRFLWRAYGMGSYVNHPIDPARNVTFSDAFQDTPPDSISVCEDDLSRADVQDFLNGLNERDRHIIHLILCGYSIHELYPDLCSERMRAYRAIERIRKSYAQYANIA